MIAILDLDTITLTRDTHASREAGTCATEAMALLAGLPHTSRPECVSPVILNFMGHWNEDMPDDETRGRLLKPLLRPALNTRGALDVPRQNVDPTNPSRPPEMRLTSALELRRACKVLNWSVHVYAPAWLRLIGLDDAAVELCGVLEVTHLNFDFESSYLARCLKAARCAASALSGADGGNYASADVEAKSAQVAKSTAGAAAWCDADSAGHGGTAAYYVGLYAARVAVKRGLDVTPVVAALQESAQRLVLDLCQMSVA